MKGQDKTAATEKLRAHLLIIEARFYDDIGDLLVDGAIRAIEFAGSTYERVIVPGALEIPAAIRIALDQPRFDGFVALGCIIRGETYHFEVVANESARGIMAVGIEHGAAIGNGILTVNDRLQAVERADRRREDKGGGAARAALCLIRLARTLPQPPKTKAKKARK